VTRSKKILVGAVGLFAVLQLVRCQRTNPPVTGDLSAPAPVAEVLRRACYDCHSNETVWPWYSHVAPVSWLIHRDVAEGRRELNFSEWDRVTPERRKKALVRIGREVERGDMPLWFYLPMHSLAKLSDADKQLLHAWYAAPAGG
jgi:hypothetical protein